MEITNDILTAYLEGRVSDEERKAVRQYLIENPSIMEDVLVMLDEDIELESPAEEAEAKQGITTSNSIVDVGKFMNTLGSNFCYSAAAFVPMHKPKIHNVDSKENDDNGILKRMDDLLSEIGF